MSMGNERGADWARKIIEAHLYREDPQAFFLSKMLPLAELLLEQFGIDAVPGGNGERARFFDSQGLACPGSMPPGARVLAESYARIDEQWTLAECGYLPENMQRDAAVDAITEADFPDSDLSSCNVREVVGFCWRRSGAGGRSAAEEGCRR